jgi:hypothetical protein
LGLTSTNFFAGKDLLADPKGKTSRLPGQQAPGFMGTDDAVLNWMIPVATPILSFQAGARLQAVDFLGGRAGRFGGFRQSGQVKRVPLKKVIRGENSSPQLSHFS